MKQFCSVDEKCGACQLLAIPYDEQLVKKQAELAALFQCVLERDDAELLTILGMAEPFHYRNKVISPYVPGKRLASRSRERGSYEKRKRRTNDRMNGRMNDRTGERREILCGMYEKGTHRVISTEGCLLENEAANRIVIAIRDLMPRYRIEPYDERSGKGFLRHAVIRVGHRSGEILVTLVTNAEAFPGAKSFCRDLVKRCPEITTIVQNVNTRMTNVVLGEGKERTLYGPGFILDRLCGLSFRISSHSFYQVNAVQTEVLYRKAIELADLKGSERILDAYCGTGTIGLVAARALEEKRNADQRSNSSAGVIGVDKVAGAIVDARNNAKHNGIAAATFVTQDAGAFMNEVAQRGESLDVLFMDPPRAGASEEFLQAVARSRPGRIVYISCNPKTQVRDIACLQDRGYKLRQVQPVDMFPHTEHIESIALLEL